MSKTHLYVLIHKPVAVSENTDSVSEMEKYCLSFNISHSIQNW